MTKKQTAPKNPTKRPTWKFHDLFVRLTQERWDRLKALQMLASSRTLCQFIDNIIDDCWRSFPDHAHRDEVLATVKQEVK